MTSATSELSSSCPCERHALHQDQLMVTRRLLGLQTLMLVYNDAVPALLSGTEGRLEGCVLIAGTGKSSSFVALVAAVCLFGRLPQCRGDMCTSKVACGCLAKQHLQARQLHHSQLTLLLIPLASPAALSSVVLVTCLQKQCVWPNIVQQTLPADTT